ncbi:MAG: hypothetical protein J5I98_17935, partial [Phaeodactylibacter sp.]|nr:hypothetical protein [Phaeodactylibacter sp.]
QILGSHEGIFPPHSSATGRKNGKVRFQKLAFAAKMTASKHALMQDLRLLTTEDSKSGRIGLFFWKSGAVMIIR